MDSSLHKIDFFDHVDSKTRIGVIEFFRRVALAICSTCPLIFFAKFLVYYGVFFHFFGGLGLGVAGNKAGRL